jgi:hypothetical protein
MAFMAEEVGGHTDAMEVAAKLCEASQVRLFVRGVDESSRLPARCVSENTRGAPPTRLSR